MLHRLQILLLGLTLGQGAAGQVLFSGELGDAKDEDLAFVSVLAEDDSFPQVVFTDIEGRFSLAARKMPRALIFRYVGYETLRLDSLDLVARAGQP
ncbi:MAG: hypothetical protein ABIQ93_17425, partial [Saprospiraceae bacterium]